MKTTEFNLLQKTLALQVKSFRALRGLTQEDLAYLADIDRTYVSQIERAVNNPSLQVISRIAAALDVRTVDLLGASAL